MKHIRMCVITGLYIVAILSVRGNDAWTLLRYGNLNELGDFLAGFFTPLAFFWLVYGYLLQSEELGLQRKELELTRDQLGKQTELLQEQVTAVHRASKPDLTISRSGGPFYWTVENKGGAAKNMELLKLNEKSEVVYKLTSLARNDSFQFGTSHGDTHSYEARFSSELSEKFYQRWEIGQGKCKEITAGPESLATEE